MLQHSVNLYEKYCYIASIIRIAATTLSEFVVVLKVGITYILSSKSITFFAIISVIHTAKAPKSTVQIVLTSMTLSSFCPVWATKKA